MLSALADSGRTSLPPQDINNQPRRVEATRDPDEERGFYAEPRFLECGVEKRDRTLVRSRFFGNCQFL
jgi:hypothetical protein